MSEQITGIVIYVTSVLSCICLVYRKASVLPKIVEGSNYCSFYIFWKLEGRQLQNNELSRELILLHKVG